MDQTFSQRVCLLVLGLKCPKGFEPIQKWLETIPASPKTIGQSLLLMYQCEKYGKEFLAAEKAQATLVERSPERCVHCGSTHIELISKPDADINLYFLINCRTGSGSTYVDGDLYDFTGYFQVIAISL